MSEDKYTEKASFQRYKEETWKTKVLKLFYFVVVVVLVLFLLIWVFSDSLFGIQGLNLGKKYVRHLSFEIVLIVACCSTPLFWIAFRKLRLFINGLIIDFTHLPNITVNETSKGVESVFYCDSLPTEVRFKDQVLNNHQLEFALMLGEWKTANAIQEVYNNNVRYRKLLESYAIIVNDQGEEIIKEVTIENIKEALLKGEDIGKVFIPEIEDVKEDKGKEN